MRFVVFFLIACGLANTVEAQLFSRLGRGQVSASSCPGGVCPASSVSVAPTVGSRVANVFGENRGHWSYPGGIDAHLESEHGVSTAGMSREQKLDLHDSLHEGRPTSRGVYQTVRSQSRVNYGSTGYGYGSSGSGVLRVGYPDASGHIVTSISSGCQCLSCQCGKTASSSSSSVGALSFKSRKQSRQVILEAAEKGLADGSLTANEAQAIRLAARSPRMLNRIEDLILEKAQSSGAYSFALDRNGDVIKAAIDWEAIGDFILKIAPIIFKLIEMFAMDATMPAATIASSVDGSEQFNYVATVGFEFTAA